jgi:outer membrane protein assembly factor BamB
MRRLSVAAVLASLVVLGAPVGPAGASPGQARSTSATSAKTTGDWTMFHNSNDRVGYNSSETGIGTSNAANLTLKWSFMSGASVWSSPTISAGIVYFGSDDKKIYAMDAATGEVLWTKLTGDLVRSSAAVASGVVYIGSDDNKVYALNATTGATVWTATLGDDVEQSAPLVANGMVYVGSLDGFMYALNQSTGAVVWSYDTWAVRGSAAISGTTLYFGSDESKMFAVNATTGALIWSTTLGGMVRNTPAISGTTLYIGADDYKVYALDTATGAIKWQTAALSGCGIVRSAPAVANGKVYVDTGETCPMDSHMYVFDSATGVQVCNHEMADYSTSSVAVANGVAYVGSFSHQLYAFNAADCTKLWDSGFTLMAGGLPSSPAVSGGVVYVGSLDGGLYAFWISAGAPVASYVSILSSGFSPSTVSGHKMGYAVKWTNNDTKTHTATDSTGMGLYDSGSILAGKTYTFQFVGAGVYNYKDTKSTYTGIIKVPMIISPTTGGVTTPFTIQWATAAPPAGFVYDVQIQRPGSTTWSNWKTGVTTTSATFTPDTGTGTYWFKAHIKNSSNGKSCNYSTKLSIVVS